MAAKVTVFETDVKRVMCSVFAHSMKNGVCGKWKNGSEMRLSCRNNGSRAVALRNRVNLLVSNFSTKMKNDNVVNLVSLEFSMCQGIWCHAHSTYQIRCRER